jgi:hypothetical protein
MTAYWAPELTWLDTVLIPASDIWAMVAVMHYLVHSFLLVEDIWTTKERLKDQDDLVRYPLVNYKANETRWWANATRQVVPISLEPECYVKDDQQKRPTPTYSRALNRYLGMALRMESRD